MTQDHRMLLVERGKKPPRSQKCAWGAEEPLQMCLCGPGHKTLTIKERHFFFYSNFLCAALDMSTAPPAASVSHENESSARSRTERARPGRSSHIVFSRKHVWPSMLPIRLGHVSALLWQRTSTVGSETKDTSKHEANIGLCGSSSMIQNERTVRHSDLTSGSFSLCPGANAVHASQPHR